MKLPFPKEARQAYFSLLNDVFDSNFWSEGQMVRQFEEAFGAFTNLEARTISNGGAGLLAILNYVNVKDAEVIVPTNTFWATSRAVQMAGGKPVFADVSRADLCITAEHIQHKITPQTKAVIVVHIGGHIAFDIEAIADLCQKENIKLIEDCAHSHGAVYNGKIAGQYGIGGAYSFYATKSLPLGEGGMVVSNDADLIQWVEKYRNYGKEVINGHVTYPLTDGFNFRMNEFTAALGLVQMRRFPEILDWKRKLAGKFDRIFKRRVMLPDGMVSGYYKYIVWDYSNLTEKMGQVFGPADLNHRIAQSEQPFPNAEWIAEHHQCPPIYHGWEHADKSVDELTALLLA